MKFNRLASRMYWVLYQSLPHNGKACPVHEDESPSRSQAGAGGLEHSQTCLFSVFTVILKTLDFIKAAVTRETNLPAREQASKKQKGLFSVFFHVDGQ